jgi:hypothetical protein
MEVPPTMLLCEIGTYITYVISAMTPSLPLLWRRAYRVDGPSAIARRLLLTYEVPDAFVPWQSEHKTLAIDATVETAIALKQGICVVLGPRSALTPIAKRRRSRKRRFSARR